MTWLILLFGNQIAHIHYPINVPSVIGFEITHGNHKSTISFVRRLSYMTQKHPVITLSLTGIGKYCSKCDHKLSFYEYHYCPVIMLHMIAIIIFISGAACLPIDLNEPLHITSVSLHCYVTSPIKSL